MTKMAVTLIKILVGIKVLLVVLHTFPSRANAVLSQNSDSRVDRSGLQTVSQADLPTTHGLDGRTLNRIIFARQFTHNVPLVHGWNIYYNHNPMLMPVQAAAVALITMWDAILQEPSTWAALPCPGAFSIRFGNYLRVHFHPVGIEVCPRYLVQTMIRLMRVWAQDGFVNPFSVVLARGPTMVHVWIDILPGIGVH